MLKKEQPEVDSQVKAEVNVELNKDDVRPSTSCEGTEAPPPQPGEDADTGGGSVGCKVCGLTFSYCGSLRNHAEVHADDECCFCGVCGELQPDKRDLLVHLQAHRKVHACKFCGKTFQRRVELEVHARTHTGEKPFSCKACGKRFSRKSNMEIHMRTHTGEKPHRCDVCGKRFNITSSDMKVHLRTHTGERPYSCAVCGKAFMLSTPLKYHMKHHTEERPYCCSRCNRSFSDMYTLRRHMKTQDCKKKTLIKVSDLTPQQD
ncbi:zinc finger protein 239-like [Nematolebias whitei]|uniref:zinc finger protein 239-like n=1 Tax=Nematolebias whitei TaxID=451745 RepID=UPI00189AED4E|nr:zinc finger protein 239-like [Nematolebias whitei]